MQLLFAPIEEFVLGEKTFLSKDTTTGQTELSILNSDGFAIGDYIIIGEIGNETTELKKISSLTTTNVILTDAIVFAHPKNTKIRKIRYDQRKFYRSSSQDGVYIHLSSEGSPVSIRVDTPDGTYLEDSDGTTSSWYKATYYNSSTLSETSLDNAIPTKADDSEHYTSIYKIKHEAGFKNNDYIETELIDRYRSEAEAEVNSYLANLYVVPFVSPSKLIQHITTLLAAGNLLAKEYGLESDIDISKTGESKIKRAEELLKKIVNRELILIDNTGSILSQNIRYVSCSNKYNPESYNKGELFTLENELFKAADPEDGAGSTERTLKDSNTGFK